MISKKNMTRVPGDMTIPLWPRKSAAMRTKSSSITPEIRPAAKGEAFDLLAEISPVAMAAIQSRAAEKGTESLAGSAVGNIAAVIRSDDTRAQTSTAAVTTAESFKRLKNPSFSRVSLARAGKGRFCGVLFAVVFISTSVGIIFLCQIWGINWDFS